MKLRKVDPRKIIWPQMRVTARMDEETADQFAQSVAQIGIDEPIKVYEVEGQLYGSDGKHRADLAIRLGLPLVDATVREGTMEDVVCNNLQSGHLRGKHPVSEMIRSVAYLWIEKGYDSIKIHEKTGLTQAYVEKLQTLSRLTPLILAGLDEGLIGVGQASALTRIKDPVSQESVFHTIKGNPNFRGRATEEFVDEVLKVPAPDMAPPVPVVVVPAKIQCAYCGVVGDANQFSNPHTCGGCMMSMHQSIVMARADIDAEAQAKKNAEQRAG